MSSTTAKKPHSAPRKRKATKRTPKPESAPKVSKPPRVEPPDTRQLGRLHLRLGLKYATWLHQQAAFPSQETMTQIVERLIDAEMRKAGK